MRITIFTLCFMLLFCSTAFATTIRHPLYDSKDELTLWANQVTHSDEFLSITVDGKGEGKIVLVNSAGLTVREISVVLTGEKRSYNAGGANGLYFVATSGYFYATLATTTNPLSDTVIFDTPGGGSSNTVKNLTWKKRYIPEKDVMEVSYTGWPSNVTRYELEFIADNGSRYVRSYDNPPSGIHYLTCNDGKYTLNFYDSSGNKVAKAGPIPISELKSPTCNSYPDDTKPMEGAEPGVPDDGSGGNTDPTDPTNPTKPCESEECKKIKDMLECPYWDDVMGDLTKAVGDAFNWKNISKTLADEMVPRMGAEMDRILGHPAPPPTIKPPSVSPIDGTTGVGRPDDPVDSTPPAEQKDLDSIDAVSVEPDTTEGIDLTGDPIEKLPHDNDGYTPIPGQESGGEKPMKKDLDAPIPTGRDVEPPSEPDPRPGGTGPIDSDAPKPSGNVTPPPRPEMPMQN